MMRHEAPPDVRGVDSCIHESCESVTGADGSTDCPQKDIADFLERMGLDKKGCCH